MGNNLSVAQERIAEFDLSEFAYNLIKENPLGYAGTWKKYDQIINPWQFGEPWNKRTCLWLKNLPLLQPTNIVKPIEKYYPNGKKKVCTDIMSHGGAEARRKSRSKFWEGIANAMAEQWGGKVTST